MRMFHFALQVRKAAQQGEKLNLSKMCMNFRIFKYFEFCICDEAASLSHRELSCMYLSSDGVFTLGLPDHDLDATDPVSDTLTFVTNRVCLCL